MSIAAYETDLSKSSFFPSSEQLKRYGRLLGALYIILLICGPFSLVYVPASLFDPVSADQTTQNIIASQGLLRWGVVGIGAIFLTELFIAALIYFLFRSVNPFLAMTAAFTRLGNAVIQGANLLIYGSILILTKDNGPFELFSSSFQSETVMYLMHLNQFGELIWEMFFACHCLLLGVLVYRSGFIPKTLGALLSLAGLGYGLHSFGSVLLPDCEASFDSVTAITAMIGELPFVFWLLLKGLVAKE